MKKILFPALMILMGFIALSFTPAKDGIELRLNLQKGTTHTINTKASLMSMMEVQGQSMSMSQVIESRQSFSAKELGTNEVTIEGQTEAIKMTISQMGMTLTYDSEHPEKTSPMLAGQTEELSKALHKLQTATFDLQGNLVKDDVDEDESNLTQFNAIIPLPTEPVEVGSSWTFENNQVAGNAEIQATMTYTVTKISKKSIDLDVKGVVSTKNDISGSFEGTATLDPQTGLLITSSIKQNISMTMNEQGLTIPMTITGTTNVTVE